MINHSYLNQLTDFADSKIKLGQLVYISRVCVENIK